MLKCGTCKVEYEDQDGRRDHYASEWHRHNLKRKVAGLPSVSLEEYGSRLAALRKTADATPGEYVAECRLCGGKKFATEAAHQHHLRSKTHQDRVAKNAVSRSESAASSASAAAAAASLDENMDKPVTSNERHAIAKDQSMSAEEYMEWKMRTAPRLQVTDCLFCRHTSESITENLDHMRRVHSFYIPYIEHVTQMDALLAYLGEKVAIGNFCLHCGDEGKMFPSLEAVRQHMVEKSHCRLLFEGHEEEFEDFYDYQMSESDDGSEDGEWEEEEVTAEEAAKYAAQLARGEAVVVEEGEDDEDEEDGEEDGEKRGHRRRRPFRPRVQFGQDGRDPHEVVISKSDGTQRVLGHRGLKAFYKQKPQPLNEKEDSIRLLITQYKAEGMLTHRREARHAGALQLWKKQPTQLLTFRQSKEIHGRYHKTQMKQGMRHNKLFRCWTDMNVLG